jgi:hypothetical protein
MKRSILVLFIVAALTILAVVPASANRGDGELEVVFVESQGLYFDTFIPVDPLPAKGPFQELKVVDGNLVTDYGPGDPGYLGGRWWMDTNGNETMDEDDRYFLCPLLGPGRTSP